MSKIQQIQQQHAQTSAKANKAQEKQKAFNPAQLFESPESMQTEDVLNAQQTVGNQVVQRALDKDDRRKGLTDQQGNLRQDLSAKIQQKRGGGAPLPENIQQEASKKLGRNFKDVRIHTDETADTLSRTISARAFTIGKDIFFKNGVFSPSSSAGRETIIHELTHVVQQGGRSSASGALKLGAPDTAHEKEADRIGKKHAASVGAAPAGAVQRESEEDELMMQSEEEEELLQAQSDEEELQMQSDSDLDDDVDSPTDDVSDSDVDDDVMMQGDEEELQMQSAEEDELQMQPDAGNTIQRSKWKMGDSGKWEKEDEPVAPKKKAKIPKAPKMSKALTAPKKSDQPKLKMKKGYANLDTARAALGVSSWDTRPQKQFEKLEEKREKTKAEMFKDKSPEEGVDSKRILANTPQGKKDAAKEKWLSTVGDAKASKEDRASAKEKLRELYPDSKDDIKAAKAKRNTSLQDLAKSGDEDAFKTMKEKKENSFWGQTKGALKDVFGSPKGWGAKAVKGIAGSVKKQGAEGLSHFLGVKAGDKDDDSDDGKAKAGSGGGGSGVSEMIADLHQENKKLKEQIAQLKAAAQGKGQKLEAEG